MLFYMILSDKYYANGTIMPLNDNSYQQRWLIIPFIYSILYIIYELAMTNHKN